MYTPNNYDGRKNNTGLIICAGDTIKFTRPEFWQILYPDKFLKPNYKKKILRIYSKTVILNAVYAIDLQEFDIPLKLNQQIQFINTKDLNRKHQIGKICKLNDCLLIESEYTPIHKQ